MNEPRPSPAAAYLPAWIYDEIFRRVGISLLVTDAQLDLPGPRIVCANEAFERLTGYGEDEVVGRTPRLLQGAASDRAVLARLKRELATGQRFVGETVNYRKDGTSYRVSWSVDPLRDPTGRVTHFVAVQRDVTEERRLSEQVSEQAVFLQRLLNALPHHAVIALDPEGFIISWNDQAASLTGYSGEEVLGRPYAMLHRPEDRAAGLPEATLRRAQEQGEVEYEAWRVRRDGTQFWATVTLSVLTDRDGRRSGYVKVVRDLTDRRATEEKERELRAELERMQRIDSLGLLAGGMAHDFNNLLGAILAQVEMLRWDSINRPELDVITRACLRGRQLTGGMLQFCQRKMDDTATCDLVECTADVVRLMRAELPRVVAISFERPAGPVRGRWNAGAWMQVLMNLCLNARDALAGAPGRITISFCAERDLPAAVARPPGPGEGERLVVAVQDTGPGISPDLLPRIFEPLFTTKAPGRGSGLGLAVVRKIVEAWDGRVEVESAPGRGTVFRLFLPPRP